MNRKSLFNRLQFSNHPIFNQNIQPVTGIHLNTLIHHRQNNFRLHIQSLPPQFMHQTGLIGTLEGSPGPSAECTFMAAPIIFSVN